MVHAPLTLRRYTHKIVGLPFFYCPDCGTEIQPSAITMCVYSVIVMGGTLGTSWLIVLFGDKKQVNIISITVIFIFFAVLGNLWWKFFGKLKEPYQFPWEK